MRPEHWEGLGWATLALFGLYVFLSSAIGAMVMMLGGFVLLLGWAGRG